MSYTSYDEHVECGTPLDQYGKTHSALTNGSTFKCSCLGAAS